jgi:LPXTG-motif cell wall-anchored protein
MNKNLILIGGAVALLGAGAFMYFKNKKKSDGASSSSSSSSSTSPLSEIAKTEQLEEATQIKQNIKDLAVSIKLNRDATIALKNEIKRIPSPFKRQDKLRKLAEIQGMIYTDSVKLKELGYTELNGIAVKIG